VGDESAPPGGRGGRAASRAAFDSKALQAAVDARVSAPRRRAYYLEVARFAASALRDDRAAVVGVSGPQGSGKSTMTELLAAALGDAGVGAISISIDDFYLTRDEQVAVARAHPGDRTLEQRGYPGTHDVELGRATLEALREGRPVAVPRYDTSAHGGRGVRAPRSAWTRVDCPLDLVFFEGWMLGFEPVPHPLADASLAAPNAMLAAYAAWIRLLDALVVLEAETLELIVDWRVEAEKNRRASGAAAMSDAEARDYIERFLPAYALYGPTLAAHPPCARARTFVLGRDRAPIALG
jgi:D-glycerate 3-kinase